MLNLHLLFHILQNHIHTKNIHSDLTKSKDFCQFQIWDFQIPCCLRDDILYVMDTVDVPLPSEKNHQTLFLLTKNAAFFNHPTENHLTEQPDFNYIATDLSLSALCNLLITEEHRYESWRSLLQNSVHSPANLKKLFTASSGYLGLELALTDEHYSIIMSTDTSCERFPLCKTNRGSLAPELFRQNGWFPHDDCLIFVSSLSHNQQSPGYFLATVIPEKKDDFMADCLSLILNYTEEYLRFYQKDKYNQNEQLRQVICDLLENRLREWDDLPALIKKLSINLKRYYRLIVVEPDEPDSGISPFLLSGLRQLFPSDIIVPYQNDILILLQTSHYSVPLKYDKLQLETLMEAYHAAACIGNQTQWLGTLRPIYLQVKTVIPIARSLRKNPATRVFQYEAYSMYHIIDLCAANCADFHHGDLSYLCHPGVIALKNYDYKYETNLCRILKQYIMNDRNMTRTAQDFFYHRNTMQKLISKITRLVKADLDEPLIRHRLLFSLLVVEYMQEYQGQADIYAKKRNIPPTAHRVK
ncbi:MAG: helix-turn-helix domain-containing protein [Clostridiales bacterium]|nr:helix-turn-helix domain-containing protein [Clostridiales bacterium]